MPGAFECSACTETVIDRAIRIQESKVCAPCFRHLFELAVRNEADYPAHWGTIVLDYTLYEYILGEDLYRRYEEKTKEYACPAPERVFCARTDPPRRPEACQNFVGRWNNQKQCVRCDKCMWYTCLRCEESFSTSSASGEQAAIEHECDPGRDDGVNQRILHGLQRGKDYQVCPNDQCSRVWALHDGCNHMRCATCKTYFCFICGDRIQHHYRHFEQVGCPLYGAWDTGRQAPGPPQGGHHNDAEGEEHLPEDDGVDPDAVLGLLLANRAVLDQEIDRLEDERERQRAVAMEELAGWLRRVDLRELTLLPWDQLALILPNWEQILADRGFGIDGLPIRPVDIYDGHGPARRGIPFLRRRLQIIVPDVELARRLEAVQDDPEQVPRPRERGRRRFNNGEHRCTVM